MKSLDQLKTKLLKNPQTRAEYNSLAGEFETAREPIPSSSLGDLPHNEVKKRMGNKERKTARVEGIEHANPTLAVRAERRRGETGGNHDRALEWLKEPAVEPPQEFHEAWELWCELDAIEDQVERLEKMEPRSITEVCDRRDELGRLGVERKRLQDALASLGPANAESVAVSGKGERLDFSMLATREQLIAAFGNFTGMNATWFDNITDKPALLRARKVKGDGRRGHVAQPLFCPFEVMLWLANPKRRNNPTRRKPSPEKAWELLEKNFPKVYAAKSIADPRSSA